MNAFFSNLLSECFSSAVPGWLGSDSNLILRRTLLGYYAEGMHTNF